MRGRRGRLRGCEGFGVSAREGVEIGVIVYGMERTFGKGIG